MAYNAIVTIDDMACPFFVPTSKFEDGGWIHPSRLPLGGGWRGTCSAPGHEGVTPSDTELRNDCNMGYATACHRLPQNRDCDSVRFSVARESGDRVTFCFVREAAHRPAGHGSLEYDLRANQWMTAHDDERVRRLAESYLQSYLLRKIQPALSESPNS